MGRIGRVGYWTVFARSEDGVATCQRSNRKSRPQEPPGSQRRDQGVRVWQALGTTVEPIPRHREAETTRNRARADRSSVCQLRPPLPERSPPRTSSQSKLPAETPLCPPVAFVSTREREREREREIHTD
ncbi:hypothetical protein CGRA01v4_02386 [Colletotrichum graminicola]|nr:hypothetical protein CGRA01v4_02386 [Colletotrichum graminicola]